jgi:hypothetical protein
VQPAVFVGKYGAKVMNGEDGSLGHSCICRCEEGARPDEALSW